MFKIFRKIKKLKRTGIFFASVMALASLAGCKDFIYEKLTGVAEKYVTGEVTKVKEAEFDIYLQEISEINGNIPFFTEDQKEITEGVWLSDLDTLGRTGGTFMAVCQSNQPDEKREDISSVTPSGWNQAYYEEIPDGWLYNRCHLLGFQLSGLNAEPKNLITGTRYMNLAMIPYENMVDDAVEENENLIVLYRVTPYYSENELVARGVLMEAFSITDNGKSVQFCVWIPNIQPGIEIDYLTGESYKEGSYGN